MAIEMSHSVKNSRSTFQSRVVQDCRQVRAAGELDQLRGSGAGPLEEAGDRHRPGRVPSFRSEQPSGADHRVPTDGDLEGTNLLWVRVTQL